MLNHFKGLTFENKYFAMRPLLVHAIHALSDLPLLSFTLIDDTGDSSKVYYDLDFIDYNPEHHVPSHLAHSLANRVCSAMMQEGVRFDGEEERWHGSPGDYLASVIRGTINRKYPNGSSVIREDIMTVRLPQGAVLLVLDKDHERLDSTKPHNREDLLHTLMLGKVNFFGIDKVWMFHQPHVKFTEISIPSPNILLNEIIDIVFQTFPFLKGHVVFGPEISYITDKP